MLALKRANDVTAALLKALADVLHAPMSEVGFTTKSRSAALVRVLAGGDQTVTFQTDFFPSYEAGAIAHIHPTLAVRMAAVSEVALKLVAGDRLLLAGSPELIIKQPIDLVAPKDRQARWFAYDREGLSTACSEIRQFLTGWVFPFLLEAAAPADLVRLYEPADPRVLRQRHWYVFVVAAYLLLDRPGEARVVAENHFSST